MRMSNVKLVDIIVYIVAIFSDSFGIALLTKTAFGATPFGIFITSAALIFPFSIGVISLLYESLYIFSASLISRSRIKFELLIYSGIFAVMIDFHSRMIPDLSNISIYFKILITVLAVVFIDLAKALFNITIFPKLSVVEFIYAIVDRYNFRLDIIQKSISLFNVGCGIIFSFLAGNIFFNVGIGTIISMFLFGTVLQWSSKPIENVYKKIV